MKPALVILAAGESRRLGRCKALVELDGTNVMTRLVRAGAVFDEQPPLVISGAHHAQIAAAAPHDVELVKNEDWLAGRTGSVRRARDARPGRALVIAPVDVPLVPADVFTGLAAAWSSAGSPDRGWLAPRILDPGRARFGHPVVIGAKLLEDLSDFDADTPLSGLRERADPLLHMDTDRREVLFDLDTPDDLARLLNDSSH